MLDPRTQIAALLLSGTLNPTAHRTREERLRDVQGALDLAERILGRSEGRSPIGPVHIAAQSTDDGHASTAEEP